MQNLEEQAEVRLQIAQDWMNDSTIPQDIIESEINQVHKKYPFQSRDRIQACYSEHLKTIKSLFYRAVADRLYTAFNREEMEGMVEEYQINHRIESSIYLNKLSEFKSINSVFVQKIVLEVSDQAGTIFALCRSEVERL